MKLVLLLTACITPSGMAYTALQDPKVRTAQYLQALQWYLDNTNYLIIMCENTNYRLDVRFNKYIENGRLEYLSFNGNNSFDKKRGKGVGESLILKYVIENSRYLNNDDVILKMTGRQVLVNIKEVVETCTNTNCVYANFTKQNLGIMAAYSQFFICPVLFLKNIFLKETNRLDDSRFYYFEHLLYDSMIKWKERENGKISEFWKPLIINGLSGSTNSALTRVKMPRFKAIVKYLFHKLKLYKVEKSPAFTDSQIRKFRNL